MDNAPTPPNNFLNWVEIKNFKSIKDLRLDCKRVNVFIGKPNVGKSNILEALGLLGHEYGDKFFEGSLRYEKLSHLFYDNDIEETISVISDKVESQFLSSEGYDEKDFDYIPLRAQLPVKKASVVSKTKYSWIRRESDSVLNGSRSPDLVEANLFDETGILLDTNGSPRPNYLIHKFDFANLTNFNNAYQKFLLPPNGSNLYAVVRRNKELSTEFAKLFIEQGLELVFYDEKNEIILQKRDGMYVIQYPFFSIADTFRRFMFYTTAIESNNGSVIIFEEPEVHSFPPYTQFLAQKMVYKENNQFFISTHSPYLLQTLVSSLDDDQLQVFVTYYENYETKVKALNPEELSVVQEYSTDIFFNLERFAPNA